MVKVNKLIKSLRMFRSNKGGVHKVSDEVLDYSNLIDELSKCEVDGIILLRDGDKVLGKGILIVEEVTRTVDDGNPYDVINMIKSYFNSLNLGFPIEYRLFLRPLNKSKVIDVLDKRLQSLYVIAESDPSNSKVRSEIERLKMIKNKILKEGFTPFEVIIFYAVEYGGESVDDVITVVNNRLRVLKSVLESQGVKCRLLKEVGPLLKRKVLNVFFRGFVNSRLMGYIAPTFVRGIKVMPLNISPLTPLGIRRRPKNTLFSEGIYLGIDLRGRNYVFWNLINSLNPHSMVIGPSGVGKTEFLTVLGLRTWLTYGLRVVYLDLRGEFKDRLSKRKVFFNHIDLSEYGLNMLMPYHVPPRTRASQLADVISFAFCLDYEVASQLYRVLVNAYLSKGVGVGSYSLSWDDVINYVEYGQVPYSSTLLRVIDEVQGLEGRVSRHVLDVLTDGLNVIDLSGIRGKEELVRVALLMLMNDSLNLASATGVTGLKFAMVIDEFWYLTNVGRGNPLPLSLLKLGRGYGVAFFTATQSFDDLKPNAKQFIDNVGLLVIMNSPSLTYWEEVSKYVVLSKEEVNELRMFMSRGDALIRILPDPRPLPVRIDIRT